MKDNPITIGFDDAAFELYSDKSYTHLIGVICQGTRMVGVIQDKIMIDGDDATEKLIKMVKQYEKQVQYVITHSITFGGFNLINLNKVYSDVQKPIIAITEREVDIDSVKKALKNKFPESYKKKLSMITEAGNLYETEINTAGGMSKIYFHFVGLKIEEVESLLGKVCIDSKLPESVRMAHLIGKIL